MRRGWWKLPVLAVAGCLAYVELRGHLPGAASLGAVLRHAGPWWLVAAVALQVVSMLAFAEQGRRLLAAFGVAMRPRTSVAVTFARSAMATGLPGGSAVAAAYGYRQFRARGATGPVAAAVTVLCGIASAARSTRSPRSDAAGLNRTPAVQALRRSATPTRFPGPAARWRCHRCGHWRRRPRYGP